MKKFLIVILFFSFCLSGCNNPPMNNQTESDYTISRTTTTNIEANTSVSNTINNNETELSSFSTKIYTPDDEARQNNIRITCSRLDGTVVKSGEIFSFCNTVGKATPEDGYEKADIFDKDGNVIKGYGGGNCQISSTLYNALLTLPNIEIIERHEHNKKVYYVEDR